MREGSVNCVIRPLDEERRRISLDRKVPALVGLSLANKSPVCCAPRAVATIAGGLTISEFSL
jgi:hypothetical protein